MNPCITSRLLNSNFSKQWIKAESLLQLIEVTDMRDLNGATNLHVCQYRFL
jgi:hypothetical protein